MRPEYLVAAVDRAGEKKGTRETAKMGVREKVQEERGGGGVELPGWL